ncbi:DivIVA domain-containing protein [Micromonospora sp. RTGN7]|uniref:DivIVA domain-containing protein n=1 Tax=Micromonospora sp. RTGN7 TaxID=3016526 RepID=UPI0039B6F506
MQRLLPQDIRAATFGNRRWRGLDPDQVYAYLDRIADELERLAREAITAKTETERLRQALRQGHCRHTLRSTNGRWPR